MARWFWELDYWTRLGLAVLLSHVAALGLVFLFVEVIL